MPVTARSASWLRTTPSKVTTAPAAASWTASASSVTLMGASVTSARTTRGVEAGSGRLGWSGLDVTGVSSIWAAGWASPDGRPRAYPCGHLRLNGHDRATTFGHCPARDRPL